MQEETPLLPRLFPDLKGACPLGPGREALPVWVGSAAMGEQVVQGSQDTVRSFTLGTGTSLGHSLIHRCPGQQELPGPVLP